MQQHIQDDRATVSLQFEDIFAGKGIGAWEIKCQAFVQYPVIRIQEGAVMGVARLEFTTTDGFGGNAGERPGNSNDTDTAATLSGSDSSDGFTRSAHQQVPEQK